MKLINPHSKGIVVASEESSKVLLSIGYKVFQEPAIEEIPAPVSTPKKAPTKRAPRKTTSKKEV